MKNRKNKYVFNTIKSNLSCINDIIQSPNRNLM